LGVEVTVNELRFTPRVPTDWKSFKLDYRYRETIYHITCLNVSGAWKVPPKIFLDGVEAAGAILKLTDDRREHVVEVKFQA
jgi:cellobiose phosphorylase